MHFLPLQFRVPYIAVVILIITHLWSSQCRQGGTQHLSWWKVYLTIKLRSSELFFRQATGLLMIFAIEKAQQQHLQAFLKPFETCTKLVSGNLPHLSLIRHEIQQVCKSNEYDSAVMKELKRLVAAKLNTRLPPTKISRLATLLRRWQYWKRHADQYHYQLQTRATAARLSFLRVLSFESLNSSFESLSSSLNVQHIWIEWSRLYHI